MLNHNSRRYYMPSFLKLYNSRRHSVKSQFIPTLYGFIFLIECVIHLDIALNRNSCRYYTFNFVPIAQLDRATAF